MNAAAFQAKDGAEGHRGPLRVLHPAVGAFVVATICSSLVQLVRKKERKVRKFVGGLETNNDDQRENAKETKNPTVFTHQSNLRYRLDDGLVGRGHLHHVAGVWSVPIERAASTLSKIDMRV